MTILPNKSERKTVSAIPRNRGRRKRNFKGISTIFFLEKTKKNSKRDRCEILRRALFVPNTRSKIARNKNCKVFPFPDSTPVIYFETVAHNVGFSSSPVFRDPIGYVSGVRLSSRIASSLCTVLHLLLVTRNTRTSIALRYCRAKSSFPLLLFLFYSF